MHSFVVCTPRVYCALLIKVHGIRGLEIWVVAADLHERSVYQSSDNVDKYSQRY